MKTSLVINSFYITYIFLITTSVITFIEALRSPIPQVRHILNLETCISVIASYFYGLFIRRQQGLGGQGRQRRGSEVARS